MAFDSLSEKLQNVFKNLRGKGRLTEADVKAGLKEVKLALLEADVSFKVVKQFIKAVEERAVGTDVLESLTPGQTARAVPLTTCHFRPFRCLPPVNCKPVRRKINLSRKNT